MRTRDDFPVSRGGAPRAARWMLMAVVLSIATVSTPADEPPGVVPEDTCILELSLPAEATVTIDGRDYGTLRSIALRPRDRGELCRAKLVVTYADGRHEEHVLLIRGGWRVSFALPTRSRPRLFLPVGHTGAVLSAAFSPDGRQIVTASEDGTAILWDAARGSRLRTFEGHARGIVDSHPDRWVWSVAFSPVGGQILTGSADKTAILWDVATGRKLVTFAGHTSRVFAVAFSPDGRQVLTGAADNTAILWDAATGRRLRTFEGHAGEIAGRPLHSWVWSVAFSADGQQILTGSDDRTAILSDAATGQPLRTFRGHTGGVISTALSRDGRQLLTGSDDKTAILWDAVTGHRLRTFQGHTQAVVSVAFSPGGGYLLTGSFDQTAILWETATGEKLGTMDGHTGTVWFVGFSPDGRQILTASADERAILWEAATGQRRQILERNSAVNAVGFSPDGQQILTGLADSTATLWDAVTGRRLRSFEGHDHWVWSAAFSPDGQQLLTGSIDQTAILWEVASGQKLRSFEGHAGPVWSVAFSPDGRQILTGSADNTAVLWDTGSGEKLRTFERRGGVLAVAFSPDGARLLTGSTDNIANLWDATTGRTVRSFEGHEGPVWSVAFSSDGRQILTGSADNTAILWNAATGQRLQVFEGHAEPVWTLAFSADGRQLLSGSPDGTAVLWDAASGEKLRTFDGHTEAVSSVAFTPAGRQVLTGGFDGTARLWDIATGEELVQLINLGPDGWFVVSPEGLFDGSAEGQRTACYHMGEGRNFVPVERFFQDFCRPRLLAGILQGERPLPEMELGKQLPPKLRIVTPLPGTVAARDVEIVGEAIDRGGGIADLAVFHNGARVAVEATTQREGDTLRRTFPLRLVEGNNQLTLRAACQDGSWESEPATIHLRYDGSVPAAELYLLVIGINRYADARLNLRFARADAEAVARVFRSRGPALYGEGKVHTRLLTDAEATKSNIKRALAELSERVQPQDTLLVWLSGHGTILDQHYYFLPHEACCRPDRSVEDEVRQSGLAGGELADWISRVPALKRGLICDTGKPGAAIAASRTAHSAWRFDKALQTISRSHGLFIIASTASDDQTREAPELGHGALTYTLLAGLGEVERSLAGLPTLHPPDDEAVLTVYDWFRFARERAPALSERFFGGEQRIGFERRGEDFPILRLKQ